MLKLIKKYEEIIRYLIVGVMTTVVSLATYYICVYTFLNPENAVELQVANVISWIAAVSFAYITNRIFVFKSKNKNILQEMSAFFAARVGSLGLEMLIMFLSVTWLGMNDKVMKLVVQFVVVVANYVLSKIFVFRKK